MSGWAAVDGGLPMVRAVAGVEFLGGFTTFSAASVELVRLVRAERLWSAVLLAIAMVGASVGAALLGLVVGGFAA